MDITTMRILATLALFATFIGIFAWACARRHRDRFDEAAQLPFVDDFVGQAKSEAIALSPTDQGVRP